MSDKNSLKSYEYQKQASIKQKLNEAETELETITLKLKEKEIDNRKLNKNIQLNKKIIAALVLEKEKLFFQANVYKKAKKDLEINLNQLVNDNKRIKDYFMDYDTFWHEYFENNSVKIDDYIPRKDSKELKNYIEQLNQETSMCSNCEHLESVYQEKLETSYEKVRELEGEVLYWKTKFENSELKAFQTLADNSHNNIWRDRTINYSDKENLENERNNVGSGANEQRQKLDLLMDQSFEDQSKDSMSYNEIKAKNTDKKEAPKEVKNNMIFESLHNDINTAFEKLRSKYI